MTASGEYLSGYFAFAQRDRARAVIEQGWRQFEKLAQQRGYKPKPVPKEKPDFTMGEPAAPGGLKLETAVRDLPRGDDTRPGESQQHRDAYNMGWLTYTPDEAAHFVTTRRDRQPLPHAVLEKMAKSNLKDTVRGQCFDWQKGALQDGALYTQLVGRDGDALTLRITGHASLSQPGRAYACRLHGRAVYHTKRKVFVSFELIAAGQRSGADQFNDRRNDQGPAPMGVAFVIHKSSRVIP